MSLLSDLFGDTPLDLVHEVFGETVTYTTAEGVASTPTIFFKFYVGALDEFSNAVVEVRADDVASPKEGDYFLRSGDTDVWTVNDVRDRVNYWQLRVIQTKDRT